MNKYKSDIAMKLRTLRAENDLTQADVARALDISQQTYSKYESQDANIDSAIIIKLCNFYGVSSDYLLNIETKQKKIKNKDLAYESLEEGIDLIVERVLSKIAKNNQTGDEEKK